MDCLSGGMMAEKGELVVLVHGIWMTGLEMLYLRRRLQGCGFQTLRFSYASLRQSPAENAATLAAFIRQQNATRLHLVAHSLGGIILLHLFDQFDDLPPGRVVLLGSPVQGSGVARRLTSMPLLNRFLGHSVHEGLLGGAPAWRSGRELGVIAGRGGIGVGTLIGGLEQPSDGTVALAETQIATATDACALPVSHTGLLFSPAVAAAVCRFLQSGRFAAPDG